MIYVLDLALLLASLFFLFLPITDRRTVVMKLCMMTATAVLFACSALLAAGPAMIGHQPQAVAMSRN